MHSRNVLDFILLVRATFYRWQRAWIQRISSQYILPFHNTNPSKAFFLVAFPFLWTEKPPDSSSASESREEAAHLWESSDPCTDDVDQQQSWGGQQAWEGSVGAVSEILMDVLGAVSYPDAHVEAVGKDESHTAIPVGQEIRDAQKYERQGQHDKIVPRRKKKSFNNARSYSIHLLMIFYFLTWVTEFLLPSSSENKFEKWDDKKSHLKKKKIHQPN